MTTTVRPTEVPRDLAADLDHACAACGEVEGTKDRLDADLWIHPHCAEDGAA